jgi:exopolysaccharide production protein ExoQ
MPPYIATLAVILFVAYVWRQEQSFYPRISKASWLVTLWMLILASRPISAWLNLGEPIDSTVNYEDGSPIDRLFLGVLIASALGILLNRKPSLQTLLRDNRALLLYFGYLGLSVLWSDFTFISLKRWIKDAGNLIMVFLIFSEKSPFEAVKAILFRAITLLTCFSVLIIKYYPELGRYYDKWTYKPYFCGITYAKNMLGMIVYVSLLFLVYSLCSLRLEKRESLMGKEARITYLLLAMTLWLLYKAHSSTAIACSFIGIACILLFQLSFIRERLPQVGVYVFALVALVWCLDFFLDLKRLLIVDLLGRNLTLTGRTDIWQILLREDTNPLIGTGYYSFWLGGRIERISQGYWHPIDEAHNGYLENYLNTGLIGIFLLLGVTFSSVKRVLREIRNRNMFAIFQLSVLLSTLLYGVSEAIFDRLTVIWLLFLFALVKYSGQCFEGIRDPYAPTEKVPKGLSCYGQN